MKSPRLHHALFSLAAILIGLTVPAQAGQRKFVFSYETTTAPKGAIEFENWVTWKQTRNAEGRTDRFDFRHELEFGVTDRFQAAIYLADWTYSPDDTEKKARYEHSGVELIYSLTNPTTDWLGSAVYLEVVGGDDVLEVEGKLLLQKNFGPITIAYNAVLEAAWEGSKLDERTGEFQQTLGVSYDLIDHLSIGGELLHEIEFPDWGEAEDGRVWMGPNVSFHAGRFYATVAGLFQLTDVADEPDVQTRLIVGFNL
jgi:hypothetical protein